MVPRRGWQIVLREKLSLALDPERKATPGLSTANVVVVCLICASILLGVLETEEALASRYRYVFDTAHGVMFAVFAAEYAARLYAAPLNTRYSSSLRYALTPASLVDLVVLVSFVMPFLGMEATVLRMLRAARLVRLARLGRYSLALQVIGAAISERRYELAVSVLVAFGLMLLSSSVLYFAERLVQPQTFGSIPRAMWWSVATLTTVGYGDSVPMTALGRVAAALTAFTGIGLIALPTGILAGAFNDALRNIRGGRK